MSGFFDPQNAIKKGHFAIGKMKARKNRRAQGGQVGAGKVALAAGGVPVVDKASNQA